MMKKLLLFGALPIIVISGIVLVSLGQNEESQSIQHEQLVALGDSLTYGVGDGVESGYTDNLQTALSEDQHNTVTVHNYGIPGQESDGLLKQLKQSDIETRFTDADYFIVFIGTNDLIKSNGGDLTAINEEAIETGKEDYVNNVEEILSIIRWHNSEAPILYLGLYNPYPESKEIERIINDWNQTSKNLISDDQKVKFISTNDLFKEKSTKYFSDSLHPNSLGYELLAEKIVQEYNF